MREKILLYRKKISAQRDESRKKILMDKKTKINRGTFRPKFYPIEFQFKIDLSIESASLFDHS